MKFLGCTSLVAQMVKRLATMRETWVQSLGREDRLEKEMATHSSILAWEIPWREEPGRLQSMGSQRVRHDWAMFLSPSLSPLTLSISASQAINLDSVASASQARLYCKLWYLSFFFFLSVMQIFDLNFDCWGIHFKKATISKTALSNNVAATGLG